MPTGIYEVFPFTPEEKSRALDRARRDAALSGVLTCPDCGCAEADHAFGDEYRALTYQLVNDGECPRDGPNVCLICLSCSRDEEGL